MSYTEQQSFDLKTLEQSFKSGTVTIIFESEKDIHTDIKKFHKLFSQQQNRPFFSILSTQNSFVPFLTVEDNLLMGLNRHRKQIQEILYQWLDLLHIDRKILTSDAKSMNEVVFIELQLIRSVLSQQTLLIMDALLDQISPSQIQGILPFIQTFAKTNNLAVAILTSDQNIVSCSYYDYCIEVPEEISN